MIMNVHEAKTHLSQLLNQVALGDTVVIARDGVPVAQLVPIVGAHTARVPNLGKGKMLLTDDWDSPETNARVTALMLGEPLPEDMENKDESSGASFEKPVLAFREPKTICTTGKKKTSKTKSGRATSKRPRRTTKKSA